MTERIIKDTVKEYIFLMSRLFPLSKVDYSKNYVFFNNSFVSLEIIDAYSNSELIEKKYTLELLDGLKEQIMLLLYQFPIYHELIISSIKRSISETLLRIILSIYDRESDNENIKKMSYRTLSEKVKDLTIYQDNKFKSNIDIFLTVFGESSTVLHSNFNFDNNIQYLASLNRPLNKSEIKNLNTFSLHIKDALLLYFPHNNNIDDINLPTNSKIILHNAIGTDLYDEIFHTPLFPTSK